MVKNKADQGKGKEVLPCKGACSRPFRDARAMDAPKIVSTNIWRILGTPLLIFIRSMQAVFMTGTFNQFVQHFLAEGTDSRTDAAIVPIVELVVVFFFPLVACLHI